MNPIRVLVADDHAVVAEGLRCLLEAEGDIEVVGICEDGLDAVRKATATSPDVIMMDIAMPHLNGIDATGLILEREPAARVIMLSMFTDPDYVRRALRAGAKGYLPKKTAGSEVIAAVRAVHAGRTFISGSLTEALVASLAHTTGSALDRLSVRERQVLQLTVEGRSTSAIAASLSLSPRTVETYRMRLMDKLGIADLPGLVKFAIHHGVTTLD